jgi:hypothetical protein
MPANKNALIRYKTIDRCLRNRYRRWTIEDLVDACSDALYDMEGIRKGISLRTVQGDIQMMRSDKLGYNAPIEVYDQRYYRYADPQYSITDMPLNEDDFLLLKRAVDLLGKNENQPQNGEMYKVLKKVKNRLTAILNFV